MLGLSARFASALSPRGPGPVDPPWALVGRGLVGPLGPCGTPWALVGWAIVGPLGPRGLLYCLIFETIIHVGNMTGVCSRRGSQDNKSSKKHLAPYVNPPKALQGAR